MQSLLPRRAFAARRSLSAISRPSRSFTRLTTPSIRHPIIKPPIPRSIPQRWNSSLAVPALEAGEAPPRPREPSYQLTFTCKPCSHRSTHLVTKQGYHKGTVLIQCPECKNRHVISDHLKIFMDQKSTLEDILAQKGDLGNLLKKGKLGMRQGELVGREGDEDIEFWDDGSSTAYKPAYESSEPRETDYKPMT